MVRGCARWGESRHGGRVVGEVSMAARAEITRKHAQAYVKASKKLKGGILDQVCGLTGWSRDNARRRLTARAATPGRRRARPGPKPGSHRYSYDALKVLQLVWSVPEIVDIGLCRDLVYVCVA